jgi:caffeic acid 3-O-methyltransferase
MSSINQLNIALNDEDHFMFAMDLVSSQAIGSILTTALELDLLEILSKAGSGSHLSCSEIASQLPTKNPNAPEILDRMLRFLVSYSIITCKIVAGDGDDLPQRLYGLSPASKYLVRNEDGFCLGTMMLSQQKFGSSHWNILKDAILGEAGILPFEMVHGKTFFETLAENEEMYKFFSKDMTHYTAILTKKILQVYQGFDGLKVLVDIGGGFGINLSLIVSKYPTIKGINFDVPNVIKNAPPVSGVEHIGGDMFSHIPTGDAIFMKWILHDWSDEKCVKLLQKCYDSLPETGKVIIVESVVPEFPENNLESKLVLQMDMFMLCGPGAKERTMTEFEVLARAAGFTTVKPVCCVCTLWVIELHKKCAI